MGRDRYKIFDQKRPHFFTCTVVNWLPIFANPAMVSKIYKCWEYLQQEERLIIFGYVIMENHLHLIASSPTNLRKEIAAFRSYTAKQIIDSLKEKKAKNLLRQLKENKLKHRRDRTYQLWQQGSHPKVILSKKMMLQKLTYMHNNPVKRGYVDDPTHWRYSSARDYSGMEGLIKVTLFQ
ncbi:MAG TPA: transposase [Bacteroidetes bacterium]|nr:transposase [Bacteroidota bacterium]